MVYLTIASNSQEVVNMINGTDGWLSNVGNLVDDIRMLLVQLGNAKVVYQPHEDVKTPSISLSHNLLFICHISVLEFWRSLVNNEVQPQYPSSVIFLLLQKERTYTQNQLKNKWNGLKKDWQLWTSLVGKETGLGWDTVKKTINSSNEWWDKKVKETPEAAKFRTCGLKHADQLDILFKDIAMTGDGAWAPSQGFVHDVENELTHPTENSHEDGVYDLENGLEFNEAT
ncbi:hypothetical protein GBA52_008650 [Prunus armeniaca]|nr:hypothetical protein GBA52_008650 [Prunus armeniaca]